MNAILSTVPVWGLVALGILFAFETTLVSIAMRDLSRRPIDQVVFGRKWVWVAVILLMNTLGPVIYLAAARKPVMLADYPEPSGSTVVRTGTVADMLYGPRDGTGPR
jgi:Phospholipase_D-nuclease N-terminal